MVDLVKAFQEGDEVFNASLKSLADQQKAQINEFVKQMESSGNDINGVKGAMRMFKQQLNDQLDVVAELEIELIKSEVRTRHKTYEL